jgi:hypothetical protein
MNILLTGGRAPATLDIARAFHRAGHNIFMAESLRGNLSQPSGAIKANFVVPAPRWDREAFLSALKQIITENQIDLLIPAFDEVFHIGVGRERLPCVVFAEPIDKLDQLYNKWNFVINAIENDLYAPETMLINNQDTLLHAYAHWRELVLKPVYSRFASQTLPPLKKALSTLKYDSPWIAQEYVEGQKYSTYSICHNGHITAHATHPSNFTTRRGATILFKHVEHPAIFRWVKTFVQKNQFSGQISFDFIQAANGQLSPLECTPRATGGAHLLASHPQFVEAFLNPLMNCITPLDNHTHMFSTAMLIHALPASLVSGGFLRWLKSFLTSDDVILDFRDPLPFLLQFRSIFAYLALARKERISPLEASTFDIEWNGEQDV